MLAHRRLHVRLFERVDGGRRPGTIRGGRLEPSDDVPDEGGNQRRSEAIRGDQRRSEAIRGDRRTTRLCRVKSTISDASDIRERRVSSSTEAVAGDAAGDDGDRSLPGIGVMESSGG